jgi:hypothetical protein
VTASTCPLPSLDAVTIDAIARRVVELLHNVTAPTIAPRYADALSNPLGSPRAFADAARRGDFPTFRRCRRVTALWLDVEAWIESRPSRRAQATDIIDPAALLRDALASRRQPARAATS